MNFRIKKINLFVIGTMAAIWLTSVEAYQLDDAVRETGLPPNLIRAIALEESQRKDPSAGVVRPWPWTLRAQNQAWYFDSREEAEEKLLELKRDGLRNIDVGAMQINVRWNGHLTPTPELLLDPQINLWAFSRVIKECQSRLRAVREVIECYHAGRVNTEHGVAYANRVIRRFHQLQESVQ